MNKLLIVVFDHETSAEAGLNALRGLHAAGDITLYATGVLSRDAVGQVSVKKPLDQGASGAATGLAVGSLIGLLGGPVGLLAGAAAGTVAGAVRDFWVAGVGLDFIEEASRCLLPGKVALVAEVEEEWVIPVDTALEALGGRVFRRSRSEVAEAQFDRDIAAIQREITQLESEASGAAGAAKQRLGTQLAAAQASLQATVHRAQQQIDALGQEADAKAESLKAQLGQAQGAVKARIEDRTARVKRAYHARGAKLSQAWGLTKQALAV